MDICKRNNIKKYFSEENWFTDMIKMIQENVKLFELENKIKNANSDKERFLILLNERFNIREEDDINEIADLFMENWYNDKVKLNKLFSGKIDKYTQYKIYDFIIHYDGKKFIFFNENHRGKKVSKELKKDAFNIANNILDKYGWFGVYMLHGKNMKGLINFNKWKQIYCAVWYDVQKILLSYNNGIEIQIIYDFLMDAIDDIVGRTVFDYAFYNDFDYWKKFKEKRFYKLYGEYIYLRKCYENGICSDNNYIYCKLEDYFYMYSMKYMLTYIDNKVDLDDIFYIMDIQFKEVIDDYETSIGYKWDGYGHLIREEEEVDINYKNIKSLLYPKKLYKNNDDFLYILYKEYYGYKYLMVL